MSDPLQNPAFQEAMDDIQRRSDTGEDVRDLLLLFCSEIVRALRGTELGDHDLHVAALKLDADLEVAFRNLTGGSIAAIRKRVDALTKDDRP